MTSKPKDRIDRLNAMLRSCPEIEYPSYSESMLPQGVNIDADGKEILFQGRLFFVLLQGRDVDDSVDAFWLEKNLAQPISTRSAPVGIAEFTLNDEDGNASGIRSKVAKKGDGVMLRSLILEFVTALKNIEPGYKALKVDVSGNFEEVETTSNTDEVRELIGGEPTGYVLRQQHGRISFYRPPNKAMVVDDEAKITDRPVNAVATNLALRCGVIEDGDVIRGTVLLSGLLASEKPTHCPASLTKAAHEIRVELQS